MLESIRDRNKELLEKYSEDKTKKNRLLLIKDILRNDKIFFELKIEEAFNILKDLEYTHEESTNIYIKLTSIEEYKKYYE